PKRIAVVGAGPAGLACATEAAGRGHRVTLFDAAGEIGGQFNLAKRIPGKEEFHETLRYFRHRIAETGVDLRLSSQVAAEDLAGYDTVVLATGVAPRPVDFPGHDHANVVSYLDILEGRVIAGPRVAIVGAGGIGFDVAEFLVQDTPSPTVRPAQWLEEWGIDPSFESPGGLAKAKRSPPARQVWLLQRSAGRPGARLGKTTGWIHRATLKARGVRMLGGTEYVQVDDTGFQVRVDGIDHVLPVDNVVVCAGQEPRRDLLPALQKAGCTVHVIGGADVAVELDAKRAIAQASRLAAAL
ncbi:MAG: NAD(P)/FAD-dependent oxidoreductase, partial [Pseudomonadota bacterium]|nr:NAD(P)/FAD-dependent oxidoreductase [Pseudomonadota bacterium]